MTIIKTYFLNSALKRYKFRQEIIKQATNFESFIQIIMYGANQDFDNSHEGAINLLAETDNYNLLKQVCLNSRFYYEELIKNKTMSTAENFLEILMTAISCANKIPPKDRLDLLVNYIPKINSRIIKTSLIDAISLLSDEISIKIIKTNIEKYLQDTDLYVKTYTQEILKDLEGINDRGNEGDDTEE